MGEHEEPGVADCKRETVAESRSDKGLCEPLSSSSEEQSSFDEGGRGDDWQPGGTALVGN